MQIFAFSLGCGGMRGDHGSGFLGSATAACGAANRMQWLLLVEVDTADFQTLVAHCAVTSDCCWLETPLLHLFRLIAPSHRCRIQLLWVRALPRAPQADRIGTAATAW